MNLLGSNWESDTDRGVEVWETPLSLTALPWLDDHRIRDVAIFPATAYLEIALALVPPRTTTCIEVAELALQRFVAVPAEARGTLRASRQPGPDGRSLLRIERWDDARSTWMEHARADLMVAPREALPTLCLEPLRERLGPPRATDGLYASLRALGANYGASFRGVVALYATADEALGRIERPECTARAGEIAHTTRQLDACLQTMAMLVHEADPTAPWVPVHIGRTRMHAPLPGSVWCHVRLTAEHDGTRTGDLVIANDAGEIVAEMWGVTARRLMAMPPVPDDWQLSVCWEARPAPPAADRPRRWLLLGSESVSPLGTALQAALAQAGQSAECVDSTARLAERCAAQPPSDVVDLRLAELHAPEAPLPFAVHACEGIVQALQALAGASVVTPRLWLVTRGAQALDAGLCVPAQAAAIGLGRVIATEHPGLRCARLDLDPTCPPDEVGPLCAELLADDDEDEVVLSDGRRHVARLCRGDQGGPRSRSTASRGPVIQSAATYLISGGIGGLGLSVAAWLAAQGAGHVVLLGRSGVTTDAQRMAVRDLEASGANVTIARVDVADVQAVRSAVAAIPADRPLKGVVHAAGLLDDARIVRQTRSRFERVMAPKIGGAWNLHHATLEHDLDFFVLYSSASSLLGLPGQGNYAAANAFLDAFAHFRRAGGRPATSIAWGAFSGIGGLARPDDPRTERLTSSGVRFMGAEEGLAAFAALLKKSAPQEGVVPFDALRWSQACPPAAASRMFSPLLGKTGAARLRRARDARGVAAWSGVAARVDVIRRTRAPAARLLCFPEAGGSARRFAALAELSTEGVDVFVVAPVRAAIDPAERSRIYLEEIETFILGARTPAFLFGHSLGGVLAWRVAQQLARQCSAPPVVLMPSSSYPEYFSHRAAGDAQARRVLENRLVAAGIADPAKALERFDADVELWLAMPAPPPVARLPTAIHAFLGQSDPLVEEAHIQGWKRYTNRELTVTAFRGDHFYLDLEQSGGALAAALSERLRPPMGAVT